MTWQHWFKGLAAAAIAAAANTVSVLIADPEHFNPSAVGGLKKLGTLVVVSGVVGAAMYLKQSPIPNNGQKVG